MAAWGWYQCRAGQTLNVENRFLKSFVFSVLDLRWVGSARALTSLHVCTVLCTSHMLHTCRCDERKYWHLKTDKPQCQSCLYCSSAPGRTIHDKPFCIKSDKKLFFLNIILYFLKVYQPTYNQRICNQNNFCLYLSLRGSSINYLPDDVVSEW